MNTQAEPRVGPVRRVIRRILRHKRRTLCIALATLLVGYAITFAIVTFSGSPADRRLSIEGDRTIAYQQWGKEGAARVILVHGAPANSGSWTVLKQRAQRATGDLEWLAVDRLGYGNSTRGTIRELSEQALSLRPLCAPAADGSRPVLVGHSHGGPIVLRAAVEYADQLAGIVLVAGACDPYMQDSQWFRRAIEGISPVVPEPWAVGNRELLALTDENRAMESMLDRVTCPVIIIHGTWDPVCPHDGTVEYLRSRLKNAASVEVISLARVGHNIHLSHPQLVVDKVLSLRP